MEQKNLGLLSVMASAFALGATAEADNIQFTLPNVRGPRRQAPRASQAKLRRMARRSHHGKIKNLRLRGGRPR